MNLVQKYNGFMFVGDSILLPDGTFLVGPLAEQDESLEHPEEPMPVEVDSGAYRHEGPTDGMDPARVAMRERHYLMLAERGFHCARWMPLYRNDDGIDKIRPLCEIAALAMALDALFLLFAAPKDTIATEDLKGFLVRNELQQWLTPEELAILRLSRKKANQQHADNIGWRLENMWALCWILGFEPAPTFYTGQIPQEITHPMLMEFLPGMDGTIDDVLAKATPRTAEEVGEMEDLFYCAHNAVRSAQTGHSDAVPADFHPVIAGGAIHERRHSLTWALSPDVDWEETDLST